MSFCLLFSVSAHDLFSEPERSGSLEEFFSGWLLVPHSLINFIFQAIHFQRFLQHKRKTDICFDAVVWHKIKEWRLKYHKKVYHIKFVFELKNNNFHPSFGFIPGITCLPSMCRLLGADAVENPPRMTICVNWRISYRHPAWTVLNEVLSILNDCWDFSVYTP